jgi:signal transduction histidine kinase
VSKAGPARNRRAAPDRLSDLAGPLGDIRDPARLLALVNAVLLIGVNLSLPDVLRRIVTSAVELVGARYGALGVLDEEGGLSEFVHLGIDEETVAGIGHLPEGRGILGVLIVEPRPLRLENLATHPDSAGFPPGHPTMRSFLGVPIEVRGQVFGNLYLTEKLEGTGFGPDDEALAVVLGRAAGVAIENARLYARGRDLTLLEDRERIAADLHDRAIQRLFATGLGLEALVRVASPEVAERIQTAVEDLDVVIREIRSTIFALQARRVSGRGLRMGLLQLGAEAAGALGFEPAVRLEGPVDTAVSGALAEDLLATAREALSNVARHAEASRAELALRVADDVVELTVTDDGVGPGEGRRPGGKGRENLSRRAEAHGGGFELGPVAVGRGTRARWWAPLGRP